jgi:hypothetical protein
LPAPDFQPTWIFKAQNFSSGYRYRGNGSKCLLPGFSRLSEDSGTKSVIFSSHGLKRFGNVDVFEDSDIGWDRLMTSIPNELITLSASPFTAANPSHHADAGKPFTGMPAPVSRAAFHKIILGIMVCIWLIFMDVSIFIHSDVLHYI